jgi:hypothetical protein
MEESSNIFKSWIKYRQIDLTKEFLHYLANENEHIEEAVLLGAKSQASEVFSEINARIREVLKELKECFVKLETKAAKVLSCS